MQTLINSFYALIVVGTVSVTYTNLVSFQATIDSINSKQSKCVTCTLVANK